MSSFRSAHKLKGLSPLLATAILISATLAGGAILYHYFNRTLGAYTSANYLELSVSLAYVSNGKVLVYYELVNKGDRPVNVSHIYFLPTGVLQPIVIGNRTLSPGDRLTGLQEVSGQPPASAYAVAVYYESGNPYETKPVRVFG